MKLEGQARVRTGEAAFLTLNCILQPPGEIFFGGGQFWVFVAMPRLSLVVARSCCKELLQTAL